MSTRASIAYASLHVDGERNTLHAYVDLSDDNGDDDDFPRWLHIELEGPHAEINARVPFALWRLFRDDVVARSQKVKEAEIAAAKKAAL